MNTNESFLELQAVRKVYTVRQQDGGEREVEAIQEVSRKVSEGRFVSVIGPSGCGKSTLLEIVAGLRQPSSGKLFLKGKEITGPQPSVGVVFQEESTFPWRNIQSNVEFGLEVQGVAPAPRRERASRALSLVGLEGFEHAYPRQLSGGMRQRVAIARALALDPEILLMDEPFGALDQQTRMFIGGELLNIWRNTGKTVLFVTHDINEAVFLSQEVWVMSYRPGRILEAVEIDLPQPRDISIFESKEFQEYSAKLWQFIRSESERAFAASEKVGLKGSSA